MREPVLIVTRPEPAAARFLAALGLPLRHLVHPVLRIDPVAAVRPIGLIAGLVLTSAQAVTAAQRLGFAKGLRAWCVGDRTAEAAQAAGFDAVSASGDAADLVALIASRKPALPLCHVRGRHSRGDVASSLTALGLTCVEVIAYDQVAVSPGPEVLAVLKGRDPVIIPLFSPRSATILAPALGNGEPLHIVAVSQAVVAALGDLPFASLRIASRPDMGAMVTATRDAALALGIRGALQEGRADGDSG